MIAKFKINELADLNKASYSKNNLPNTIEYVDIKSMTENVLSNIQILRKGVDKIPSRARRKISNNTIIYSSVRPRNNHYGFFENPHNNMVVSTGYITIDAKEEIIDSYYLYCILTLPKNLDYIYKLADSAVSSYPSITPADLGDMEIEIETDIKKQKKIASLFYSIDKLIFNNNKINKKSYDICFNLYNFYFNQYKNQTLELKYDNNLKKNIPIDWNSMRLSELILNIKNGDWGSDEVSENTISTFCIRGADFENIIENDNNVPNRYVNMKSFNEKKIVCGDLVVEISGGSPTQSTGRICYVNEYTLKRYDNKLISSNFCKVISLKDSSYYIWFYYLWKSIYDSGIFFNYEGKTSGLKNLLFDDFIHNVYVPVPPKELIVEFTNKTSIIFDEIQKNINYNNYLKSIKSKYNFLLSQNRR